MDDNKGFIKLDRKLLEWAWHDDPSTMALWIHILLTANYENKKWHEFDVPSGSFITSISHLSEDVGLSRNTVYKCLEKLEKTGEITRESRHKINTQIYITNWQKYQGVVNRDVQKMNKGINKGVNKGINKGVDITKEIKKERKEEVKNASSTKSAVEVLLGKTPEEIEKEKRILAQQKELFGEIEK